MTQAVVFAILKFPKTHHLEIFLADHPFLAGDILLKADNHLGVIVLLSLYLLQFLQFLHVLAPDLQEVLVAGDVNLFLAIVIPLQIFDVHVQTVELHLQIQLAFAWALTF